AAVSSGSRPARAWARASAASASSIARTQAWSEVSTSARTPARTGASNPVSSGRDVPSEVKEHRLPFALQAYVELVGVPLPRRDERRTPVRVQAVQQRVRPLLQVHPGQHRAQQTSGEDLQ